MPCLALPCHGKAWRGMATTCHATPCHAMPHRGGVHGSALQLRRSGSVRLSVAPTTATGRRRRRPWQRRNSLRCNSPRMPPPPPHAPHRTLSTMRARVVPARRAARRPARAHLPGRTARVRARAPNVQTSAMSTGGRLMPPLPSGQQYLRVMQGMGIGPSDPTYTRPDPTYTRPDPTCALTPRPRSPVPLTRRRVDDAPHAVEVLRGGGVVRCRVRARAVGDAPRGAEAASELVQSGR